MIFNNMTNEQMSESLLKQIDEWISDATPMSRQKLLNLLHNDYFLSIYPSKTVFAYLYMILKIFEKETQEGETVTIFDLGNSHSEIIDQLLKLKFLLWRMLFTHDHQAPISLLEFIQHNQATPFTLQQLVFIAAEEQDQLLLKLINLFLEQKMFRYAFYMLDGLTQLYPENENYLCLAADFCANIGKNKKKASAYLSQITNPGELTERIRKKYG